MNRVASMISTLLYEASVSPVCERNVASLLISAVGQIDHALVAKVTHCTSACLASTSLSPPPLAPGSVPACLLPRLL